MMIFPKTEKIFSNQGWGKVVKTITSNTNGRVRFQATDWPAKLYLAKTQKQFHITPNHKVKIVGREGLTLLVVPE